MKGFNQQGRMRMQRVVLFDSQGTQLSNVLREYFYDHNDLRIKELIYGQAFDVIKKQFRYDMLNPTGYAQALEEHTGDSFTGYVSKVFTLGHDVIAQADVSDPLNQIVHTLLSNCHGSTRVLLDELNAIVEQYAYTAYGEMLAGTNLTTAANALTNLLYSGEWTQVTTANTITKCYEKTI